MSAESLLKTPPQQPEAWLVGGGRMGEFVRAMDWSTTPLGPIDTWPQSLRTTVGLCLSSNFPISLVWGAQCTQIYNDGYRPICGAKHPTSMGQDFRVCWESPWPVISESFARALAGETSFLENQRMFLDRHGYLEETFFTFSFSPIRDETGGVGGLFHPVTETTADMLGQRRTRLLRDLNAIAGSAQTTETVLSQVARTLGGFNLDIPFALLYRTTPGGEAVLAAHTASAPMGVDIWKLDRVSIDRSTQRIFGLRARLGDIACGPYPEVPDQALVMPIMAPGSEPVEVILVAGVSSRLPLNEDYRSLFDLIAAAVTSALSNARAYEELKRTQASGMQQERLRALGQMASGMAHDINNTISPITLYVESLLSEQLTLSEKGRRYLSIIQRAIDDVAATVARMLEFYRQREPQATLVQVELNALVVHVLELTRARWSDMPQQRGLFIAQSTELQVHLPQILGDESEIREALANLVFNAVDAMPEGGTLTIRTGHLAEQQLVQLEVSDSGIGMNEVTRTQCLEPFFTTKGERGTGLGLAMVHGMTRRHNADIEIESKPGRGTTFRILFPTATALAGNGPSDGAPEARTRTLNLLIIDDDAVLLKALAESLQSDGHSVVATREGAKGLAAFSSALKTGAPFAAVITDLGMPHMDGRQVARKVKELSSSTPVLLLTGWGLQNGPDLEARGCIDRILAKPPKLAELRAALELLCNGRDHEH